VRREQQTVVRHVTAEGSRSLSGDRDHRGRSRPRPADAARRLATIRRSSTREKLAVPSIDRSEFGWHRHLLAPEESAKDKAMKKDVDR